MVDPNLASSVDRDAVAIGAGTVASVGRCGADVGVAGRDAVVDVDVVDDDIGDVLESNASTAGDVDIGATAVDGFEAIDKELLG